MIVGYLDQLTDLDWFCAPADLSGAFLHPNLDLRSRVGLDRAFARLAFEGNEALLCAVGCQTRPHLVWRSKILLARSVSNSTALAQHYAAIFIVRLTAMYAIAFHRIVQD